MDILFARAAIFVIYFWFGALKFFGVSPAAPLVAALFEKTISFVSFSTFYTSFAIFEMFIGALFLIAGFDRLATILIVVQLVLTALPLILLTDITWQSFFVPTLEGQYIIKNIAIVALVYFINNRRRF